MMMCQSLCVPGARYLAIDFSLSPVSMAMVNAIG